MEQGKKIGRTIAVAGAVLLLAIAAAAIFVHGRTVHTVTPPDRIELSLFLRKRETTHIFEQIAERFNASQDEITVQTVIVPNPDAELKMRAVSGTFPDLVEFIDPSGGATQQYAAGGYLAPLDDTELWDRVADAENYKSFLTIDGSIYIIPLSINFRGLFLNCELLERGGYQIPENDRDLWTLLEDIWRGGEQAMVFPDRDTWTISQGWGAVYSAEWGNQKDAYKMAAEGILPLQENEGMIQSLRTYAALRQFGQKEAWKTSYDEAISKFAHGEAYLFLQGNWAYSAIKKQNPEIELAFIPFPSSQEDAQVNVSLDCGIALSASSQHPEEARVFLEYLLSEEITRYYAENTGAYSCLKGGNQDLSYAEGFTKKFAANEFLLTQGGVPEYVAEVRSGILQELVLGQIEEQQILDFLSELNDAVLLCKEEVLNS